MEHGLSTAQALSHLRTFGSNEITLKKRFLLAKLFFSQFPNLLNGILTLAALFSFIVGNLADGVFIASILLLNATFGFVQEYRAEKSLEKLKRLQKAVCRVVRDGKEVEIETADIVPNDLVILSEGNRIPSDGTISNSKHLEVDESLLSGESLPVMKEQNDEVFSSTLVTKGNGRMVVSRTGMDTRFGHIATSLGVLSADKTPLRLRLDSLGKTLSLLVVLISFLIIPIGILQGKTMLPLAILAISVSVAAIPEGLPAVVTIALALGARRMAKKHAIVHQMQAVETLGAVQVILIDKTGTITQNTMRVRKHWVLDKSLLPDLFRACLLGNTASLAVKTDGDMSFAVIGDRTDGALLLFAKEYLGDIEVVKKEGEVVDEYVFDPATKTITTVFKIDQEAVVFVRGAPETVLAASVVSQEEKQSITTLFEAYAKEGLRVIAFGKKVETHVSEQRAHLERNLTFLGIVGLWDPPRIEAKRAVEEAKRAGVSVVMVTGDNELTALTIAKEVGLIEKDEEVVTGQDLARISDEELMHVLARVRIFARTKPEDKLRLVELYKRRGFVVGVTGDGVNDALALKRADVGIAMGEQGTDVAREASDIVLTDDNFATIVSAIEEGRRIYQNIVKVITYLLSGNLSELSLVFLAHLLGMPTPLLPTQILWVNLVTDGLPALALATDVSHSTVLKDLPRDPKEPILNRTRLLWIAATGFGIAALLLLVFTLLLRANSEVYARTAVFNLLVLLHLGIAFVVRGPVVFRVNRFLLVSVIATLLLQVVVTTTPATQKLLHLAF